MCRVPRAARAVSDGRQLRPGKSDGDASERDTGFVYAMGGEGGMRVVSEGTRRKINPPLYFPRPT